MKKVGGRRSVEELYQALFFVSPFPPECFTERSENRTCSQVKAARAKLIIHPFIAIGALCVSGRDLSTKAVIGLEADR